MVKPLIEKLWPLPPGTGRAANVPVTIFSADGEKLVRVDMRYTPPIDGHFVSLGQFRFEQNNQGFVLVSNEGTQGFVTVDAVQFIPVEQLETPAPAAPTFAAAPAKKPAKSKAKPADVKQLEDELKKLTESGPKRPMYMSVKEEDTIADTQIRDRVVQTVDENPDAAARLVKSWLKDS